MATLKSTTIQQPSDNDNYITLTDHASAPSPSAGVLHANTTSLYWEETDLAAGGGDSMDRVKSQGPTTEGSATTTGLANTSVLMASGANTAVNVLFNQGTTISGAYNATIHIAGDCNMPGCAITADGTNGSQTFNDLGVTDHTITAGGDVHHDSGENLDLRTAGIGFGSGTDTAYNDVSISFDGTGDVLTVGADGHDDFHFGKNDFTIEFWINADDIDATNGGGGAISNCQDGGVQSGFGLIENSGYWYFNYSADAYGSHTGINESLLKFAVPSSGDGTWYHVAVCRWGATSNNPQMVAYINGKAQVDDHPNFKADHAFGKTTTDELMIGRAYANEDEKYFAGHMDNIRIINGYAKYKKDFSQQLPILARKLTNNRAGEFTVRGNALYVGAGDDVSLADTGFVNRTGEDTTGEGLISVVIDTPQTVNSTAFMVPVIFKNTSDVQLTLNYNMWTAVRANTDTGDAATSRMTHYGARGVWFGGNTGSLSDTIDYNTIATSAEASDFGNLTTATRNLSACSAGARAVVGGGTAPTASTNVIEYITVASTGEATDFGDLNAACRDLSAVSDGNRGLWHGGDRPSTSNVIDFVTISVTGNATDYGDLVAVRSHHGSCTNGHRGISAQDYPPAASPDMEYFAIGTIGNAVTFGNSFEDKPLWGDMGTDDGSRGVFMGGGATPPNSDTIDYINIGSLGDSSDFGNLNTGRGRAGAVSDGSRGVLGAGYVDPPATFYDAKDLITIGTLGNAADHNELSLARSEVASTSGD